MKVLAFLHPTGDELINIFEAIRRREIDPLSYEGRKYYHLIDRRELIASKRLRNGIDSSSFGFANSPEGEGHGRGGMGIAHALAQIEACDEANSSGLVRIELFKKEFTLQVERARPEVTFFDESTGRRFVADVVYTLRPETEGAEIFGRELVLEITDQHACSLAKIRLFKHVGVAAVELKLMPSFHVENDAQMTPDQLVALRKRIRGLMRARMRVRKLHALARI